MDFAPIEYSMSQFQQSRHQRERWNETDDAAAARIADYGGIRRFHRAAADAEQLPIGVTTLQLFYQARSVFIARNVAGKEEKFRCWMLDVGCWIAHLSCCEYSNYQDARRLTANDG